MYYAKVEKENIWDFILEHDKTIRKAVNRVFKYDKENMRHEVYLKLYDRLLVSRIKFEKDNLVNEYFYIMCFNASKRVFNEQVGKHRAVTTTDKVYDVHLDEHNINFYKGKVTDLNFEIVVLYYIDKHTDKEIAEMLSLTRTAVSKRRIRTIKGLKKDGES